VARAGAGRSGVALTHGRGLGGVLDALSAASADVRTALQPGYATFLSGSEPLRPASNLPDGLVWRGNKSAKPLLHGAKRRSQAGTVLCEATGSEMCLSMKRASASSVFWTVVILESRMRLTTAEWQSLGQDLRERRFVV
jgi:hypothetical protein